MMIAKLDNGEIVTFKDLGWQSDWNGDEVGYDHVLVVGLYTYIPNPNISFYIDMETNTVLETLIYEEEEE